MGGNRHERKWSTEQALAAWRAASREVDHQKQTLEMAEMAGVTAERAERAAEGVAGATRAAMEADNQAVASAKSAAEAATGARGRIDADRAEAQAQLQAAIYDEDVARERFQQIQDRAFARYRRSTDTVPEREASGVG
jgi:hypothetical protein